MPTLFDRFREAVEPYLNESLVNVHPDTVDRVHEIRQRLSVAIANDDNERFETQLEEYLQLWEEVKKNGRSSIGAGTVPQEEGRPGEG